MLTYLMRLCFSLALIQVSAPSGATLHGDEESTEELYIEHIQPGLIYEGQVYIRKVDREYMIIMPSDFYEGFQEDKVSSVCISAIYAGSEENNAVALNSKFKIIDARISFFNFFAWAASNPEDAMLNTIRYTCLSAIVAVVNVR